MGFSEITREAQNVPYGVKAPGNELLPVRVEDLQMSFVRVIQYFRDAAEAISVAEVRSGMHAVNVENQSAMTGVCAAQMLFYSVNSKVWEAK